MPAPTTPVLYGLPLGGTAWKPLVPASFSNMLYVDGVYGSDATGQRGCAALPFQTVQAALNAMLTDDAIVIAPQVLSGLANLTPPATVVRGAAYGSGVTHGVTLSGDGCTTLIATAGSNLWNLGLNLGLTGFTLGNMVLRASGAGFALNADGTAYVVNTFLAGGGLALENVLISAANSISTKYARFMTMAGGQFLTAGAVVSHVSGGSVTYTATTGPGVVLTNNYDQTDPKAITFGSQTVRLQNGSVLGGSGATAFCTLMGQAQILVDPNSILGGLKGSGLSVSGGFAPSVKICGFLGFANSGVVDFASAGSELPDTATVLTWDFRGAHLYQLGVSSVIGGPTTMKFKVGGAAGNFQTVKLDSTTALPGCAFTADAKIHITGYGGIWPTPSYSTPGADGDIIPPQLSGTVDVSAGGTVAKTWVQLGHPNLIRTGVAPDVALLTASAQLSDPVIAARTTTGLTIISNNIGGDTACNWDAVWK